MVGDEVRDPVADLEAQFEDPATEPVPGDAEDAADFSPDEVWQILRRDAEEEIVDAGVDRGLSAPVGPLQPAIRSRVEERDGR